MDPQPAVGGPAPFLQKTYDMVEDSSTDAIVSWGSKKHTFIVWDHLEFARQLLPAYFKHSNFSSFIRQLNTYGFMKINQEKWEYSNKDFVRGERHRLKNIHRRKPIQSHSLPAVDPERLALEEEIKRLSREGGKLKEAFGGLGQMDVWGAFQFEEAERKMEDVACRLDKLESVLLNVIHRPAFVDQLVKLSDASTLDFSMFSRKRWLLQREDADGSPELVDNSANEGHSSSSRVVDFTHLFPQDFSNKLRLELCPATPNGGVPFGETEDSDDCRVCSPPRAALEGQADVMECRLFLPEEVEPMDTCVPLCQKRNNSLPWFPSNDDDDEQNISCQLKLTLASSPMNFDESQLPDKISKSVNQNMNEAAEWRCKNASNDDNQGTRPVGTDTTIPVASTTNKQGNGPSPGRVNDLFWEQFLTERPGSSENEEASSCLRSSSKEDRAAGSETWINRKDMGTMKL